VLLSLNTVDGILPRRPATYSRAVLVAGAICHRRHGGRRLLSRLRRECSTWQWQIQPCVEGLPSRLRRESRVMGAREGSILDDVAHLQTIPLKCALGLCGDRRRHAVLHG
jgi:hypothetical protein